VARLGEARHGRARQGEDFIKIYFIIKTGEKNETL
jgi:hypothetical protein